MVFYRFSYDSDKEELYFFISSLISDIMKEIYPQFDEYVFTGKTGFTF